MSDPEDNRIRRAAPGMAAYPPYRERQPASRASTAPAADPSPAATATTPSAPTPPPQRPPAVPARPATDAPLVLAYTCRTDLPPSPGAPARMLPYTLECGDAVLLQLGEETYEPDPHPPTDSPQQPVRLVLGVPVILAPELGPTGWVLSHADGTIIAAGRTLTPGESPIQHLLRLLEPSPSAAVPPPSPQARSNGGPAAIAAHDPGAPPRPPRDPDGYITTSVTGRWWRRARSRLAAQHWYRKPDDRP